MNTRLTQIALALTLLFASASARAIVLFIDLNNAPQEYGACMDGAGDDNVQVVSSSTNGGKPVDASWVERKIKEVEATGQSIDSIMLSGHDGSGHFFGEGGELYAGQLRDILNAHPATKKTAISMGLIGCYPNTVHGAENFWLRPNENVKQTFGFPVQSPTKKAKDTATLVEAYCRERKEWAAASNKEDLCKIFPNIAGLTKQLISMCTREAVASRGYGDQMCYTYEELYAKCADVDPGEEMLATYSKFFAADPCDPEFANPPLDKNAFYASGSSALRAYYNQVHLWRHCTAKLKADRGYEMPFAPKVIRLIKYNQIKGNLARLNAGELKEYDQRLRDLCLDDFTLGDITKLSRSEMNRKIDGAVRALDSSHGPRGRGATVSTLDPEPASRAVPELMPTAVDESTGASPAATPVATVDASVEVESESPPKDEGRRPAAAFLVPTIDEDPSEPAPPPKPRPVPRPALAPVPMPNPASPASPVPALPPVPMPVPKSAPGAALRPVPMPIPPSKAVAAPVPAPSPIAPAPRVNASPSSSPTAPTRPAPATPPPLATPPASAASARPPVPAKPRCETPPAPPARVCRHDKTRPEVVEKMAKMMKTTFVDLNYYTKPDGKFRTCSHFKLVEDNADEKYKSRCVISYAEASRL